MNTSGAVGKQFTGDQPDFMSDETWAHFKVVRDFPMYWETRSWHPVLVKKNTNTRFAAEWLESRGCVRGDQAARNDWLHPIDRLFLFREADIAVEFKLKWA